MRCLIQRQKCVTMRQPVHGADMPEDYETAFTICQRNQELARGDGGAGGPYAVTLNIGCPTGYTPTGIWHSHPNGTVTPSDGDYNQMRRLRLRHMCISVPQTGETQCYEVK